jgi:hypothetical protein
MFLLVIVGIACLVSAITNGFTFFPAFLFVICVVVILMMVGNSRKRQNPEIAEEDE